MSNQPQTCVGAEDPETLVPEPDGDNVPVVRRRHKAGVSHAEALVEVVAEAPTVQARPCHWRDVVMMSMAKMGDDDDYDDHDHDERVTVK